jgi:hypothetical protein
MVMGVTNSVMAGQPLTVDVSPCIHIKSAIVRLTCYDELVDQAQQTPSGLEADDLSEPAPHADSNAPVTTIERKSVTTTDVMKDSPKREQTPVTGQTISQAGRVTEENFGLPSEKQEDEEDLVELHSAISKLKEYLPQRFLVTLENGQVWRQMVGKSYRLKVGHKVRIYPSRWGKSFRLSAEGLKGFIQVERVR